MRIHDKELKQRLLKAASVGSRVDKYQIKALRACMSRATSSKLPFVDYPSCLIIGWWEKQTIVRVQGWTRAEIEGAERRGIPLAAIPPVRKIRLELIIQYEGMEVMW